MSDQTNSAAEPAGEPSGQSPAVWVVRGILAAVVVALAVYILVSVGLFPGEDVAPGDGPSLSEGEAGRPPVGPSRGIGF